jgi:hypothetical protein
MRFQNAAFERRVTDRDGVLFRPSAEFLVLAGPGELRWSYRRNLHASSFADLHLAYEPAPRLSIRFMLEWPRHLESGYVERLRVAIASGIYHALVADAPSPVGIAFTVHGIGWDDIGSSEMAFFRAASEAAAHLAATAAWRTEMGI